MSPGLTRRGLLWGLVAAPVIVKATSLMPVRSLDRIWGVISTQDIADMVSREVSLWRNALPGALKFSGPFAGPHQFHCDTMISPADLCLLKADFHARFIAPMGHSLAEAIHQHLPSPPPELPKKSHWSRTDYDGYTYPGVQSAHARRPIPLRVVRTYDIYTDQVITRVDIRTY